MYLLESRSKIQLLVLQVPEWLLPALQKRGVLHLRRRRESVISHACLPFWSTSWNTDSRENKLWSAGEALASIGRWDEVPSTSQDYGRMLKFQF